MTDLKHSTSSSGSINFQELDQTIAQFSARQKELGLTIASASAEANGKYDPGRSSLDLTALRTELGLSPVSSPKSLSKKTDSAALQHAPGTGHTAERALEASSTSSLELSLAGLRESVGLPGGRSELSGDRPGGPGGGAPSVAASSTGALLARIGAVLGGGGGGGGPGGPGSNPGAAPPLSASLPNLPLRPPAPALAPAPAGAGMDFSRASTEVQNHTTRLNPSPGGPALAQIMEQNTYIPDKPSLHSLSGGGAAPPAPPLPRRRSREVSSLTGFTTGVGGVGGGGMGGGGPAAAALPPRGVVPTGAFPSPPLPGPASAGGSPVASPKRALSSRRSSFAETVDTLHSLALSASRSGAFSLSVGGADATLSSEDRRQVQEFAQGTKRATDIALGLAEEVRRLRGERRAQADAARNLKAALAQCLAKLKELEARAVGEARRRKEERARHQVQKQELQKEIAQLVSQKEKFGALLRGEGDLVSDLRAKLRGLQEAAAAARAELRAHGCHDETKRVCTLHCMAHATSSDRFVPSSYFNFYNVRFGNRTETEQLKERIQKLEGTNAHLVTKIEGKEKELQKAHKKVARGEARLGEARERLARQADELDRNMAGATAATEAVRAEGQQALAREAERAVQARARAEDQLARAEEERDRAVAAAAAGAAAAAQSERDAAAAALGRAREEAAAAARAAAAEQARLEAEVRRAEGEAQRATLAKEHAELELRAAAAAAAELRADLAALRRDHSAAAAAAAAARTPSRKEDRQQEDRPHQPQPSQPALNQQQQQQQQQQYQELLVHKFELDKMRNLNSLYKSQLKKAKSDYADLKQQARMDKRELESKHAAAARQWGAADRALREQLAAAGAALLRARRKAQQRLERAGRRAAAAAAEGDRWRRLAERAAAAGAAAAAPAGAAGGGGERGRSRSSRRRRRPSRSSRGSSSCSCASGSSSGGSRSSAGGGGGRRRRRRGRSGRRRRASSTRSQQSPSPIVITGPAQVQPGAPVPHAGGHQIFQVPAQPSSAGLFVPTAGPYPQPLPVWSGAGVPHLTATGLSPYQNQPASSPPTYVQNTFGSSGNTQIEKGRDDEVPKLSQDSVGISQIKDDLRMMRRMLHQRTEPSPFSEDRAPLQLTNQNEDSTKGKISALKAEAQRQIRKGDHKLQASKLETEYVWRKLVESLQA